MTVIRYRRCIQCQDTYEYQLSGHGCGAPLNDGQYCPSCKATVIDALKGIKRKYECRWMPISEVPAYAGVTIEDIERWEEALRERRKTELVAQRIWPGMFNLKTGDSMSIRQVTATDGPLKGTKFQLSRWRDTPDDYEIKVPIQWDLVNDKSDGYWVEYRHD